MIRPRWITLGLSLIGVGGVWATSWLSVKCHDKAKDKKTKKEKLKTYAPAIVCGVGTSACILGSHHISRKEIAALTASCTYLAANKEKIENKIREKFGEEKLKEVKTEVKKELVAEKKTSPRKIERTGHGNVHFIDLICEREFYCSKEHVKWAFNMLNAMFKNGDRVDMNTLYELLGLKKIKEGYEWGWPDNDEAFGYSIDEPIFPSMTEGEDEKGNPMIWLDIYTRPPIKDYLEVCYA